MLLGNTTTKLTEVTMSKQTAVEWLEWQINLGLSERGLISAIKEAKQMEKEQIKNNYLKGCAKVFDIICDSRNGKPIEFIDADKYYNETYQTQITK
jgi:hypothetical protein